MNFRETKQRAVILQILRNTNTHPTADSIYEQARKEIPNISKGTVYRNLTILVEKGEVAELNINGTITRYEIKQDPHYHFRCDECGKVFDLDIPIMDNLNRKIADETGLMVGCHQLEFRGFCKECQCL